MLQQWNHCAAKDKKTLLRIGQDSTDPSICDWLYHLGLVIVPDLVSRQVEFYLLHLKLA
jgi:hypothetical protein